jgi:hypothetical protein
MYSTTVSPEAVVCFFIEPKKLWLRFHTTQKKALKN